MFSFIVDHDTIREVPTIMGGVSNESSSPYLDSKSSVESNDIIRHLTYDHSL